MSTTPPTPTPEQVAEEYVDSWLTDFAADIVNTSINTEKLVEKYRNRFIVALAAASRVPEDQVMVPRWFWDRVMRKCDEYDKLVPVRRRRTHRRHHRPPRREGQGDRRAVGGV